MAKDNVLPQRLAFPATNYVVRKSRGSLWITSSPSIYLNYDGWPVLYFAAGAVCSWDQALKSCRRTNWRWGCCPTPRRNLGTPEFTGRISVFREQGSWRMYKATLSVRNPNKILGRSKFTKDVPSAGEYGPEEHALIAI